MRRERIFGVVTVVLVLCALGVWAASELFHVQVPAEFDDHVALETSTMFGVDGSATSAAQIYHEIGSSAITVYIEEYIRDGYEEWKWQTRHVATDDFQLELWACTATCDSSPVWTQVLEFIQEDNTSSTPAMISTSDFYMGSGTTFYAATLNSVQMTFGVAAPQPVIGKASGTTGGCDCDADIGVCGTIPEGSLCFDADGDGTENCKGAECFVFTCDGASDWINLINGAVCGTEGLYDDLRVPALSVKIPASNAPDFEDFGTLHTASAMDGDGIGLYWFDASTTSPSYESVFFTAQLPHGYKEGSDIEPHVHWISDDTAGTSGTDVCWALEYSWSNVTSDGTPAAFGATTTIYGDEQHIGSGETITVDEHYITALGTITGTGKTVSSMLICRLYRAGDGDGGSCTDDYDDDAGLLEIDFHIQVDSFGSDSEYTK